MAALLDHIGMQPLTTTGALAGDPTCDTISA